MDIDITVKNYRCFADEKPVRVSLRNGFTAFVGPNNSGKSSLLRFFYEFRSLFASLGSTPPSSLANILRHNSVPFDRPSSILDINEIFNNGNQRDLVIELGFDPKEAIETKIGKPVVNDITFTMKRGVQTFTGESKIANTLLDFSSLDIKQVGGVLYLDSKKGGVGISHLSRVLGTLAQCLYVPSFRNVINVGTKDRYFDIQVGESFIYQWKNFKEGNTKASTLAALRVENDIKRIFGYKELQVNPSADAKTLQLIIDGKPYRLEELGSGIAQFILVLVNAAVRQPTYILIDEPETNLHPSLQLDFLTTLASYASEGVVFATHNLGLARASADRIYSVTQRNGISEVNPYEATQNLSEFLGELSYSGYRELGFDRVLLVEGPKDVRTVQQFLRLFQKEHKVVILPLGGSSLINGDCEAQLNEIKRISNNVSAFIDSERSAQGEEIAVGLKAFVEACRRANVVCHVLERRAIENYLTDAAIKMIKGEKYCSLKPFELLKDTPFSWSKSENWRIAREMSIDDIEGTDLFKFLQDL